MTLNTIRKIFKTGVWLSLLMLTMVAIFFMFIKYKPLQIPFLNTYFSNRISELLPQNYRTVCGVTQLSIDKRLNLVFKVENIKIADSNSERFLLETLSLKMDPRGFFPQSHRNLMNIEISKPRFLKSRKDIDDEVKLNVSKINDYLENNKHKLAKLNLSLTNTDLDISDLKPIRINRLSISPMLEGGKLVFPINGDVVINQVPSSISGEVKISNNKSINVNADVKNIRHKTLVGLGYDLGFMKNSTVALNAQVNANLSQLKHIDSVYIEASANEGYIHKNDHFENSFRIDALNLSAFCNEDCEDIKVDNFSIRSGKAKMKGDFSRNSKSNKLNINLDIENIHNDKLNGFWPISAMPRTRQWVISRIKNGIITTGNANILMDIDNIKSKQLKKSNIVISMNLKDSDIKYMTSVDPAKKVSAVVDVENDNIKFKITKGSIGKLLISKAHGTINNLKSASANMNVDITVNGALDELTKKVYEHTSAKNVGIKFGGDAKANIKVEMPITSRTLKNSDLKINATAKTSNTKLENFYRQFVLSKGGFEVDFKDNQLSFNGGGVIDDKYNTAIIGDIDLTKDMWSVKASGRENWDDIKDIINLCHAEGDFEYVVHYKKSDGVNDIVASLDLEKSLIDYPPIKLRKHPGNAAFARFSIPNAKSSEINNSDYYLDIDSIKSKGVLSYKNGVFTNVSSEYTKLGKGDFKFKYINNDVRQSIDIKGESLDVSLFSIPKMVKEAYNESSDNLKNEDKKSDKQKFLASIDVKKLYGNNGTYFSNFTGNLEYKNGSIRTAIIKSDSDVIKVNIKYPVVSITSSDAGKFFKALGASTKVNGGTLNFHGTIDKKENFDGKLIMSNFRVKDAPLATKFISFVSLTSPAINEGFSNLFMNSGIKFDSVNCPIGISFPEFTMNECLVKGPTMKVTSSGNVNIKNRMLNIKGNIIPSNIINSTLKMVPVLNEAFKGKEDYAPIGATYSISGTIEDPEGSANPLSILAPGKLKDAF